MKIYKDLSQDSSEWLQVRLGKFTASNFHIFLGNSETRKLEICKKAAERITGVRCDQDNFLSNKHIDRGNALEPLARDAYEFETGNEVEQIGFIELSETVGYSPDGLIGDDKLLEIKCLDNHHFLNFTNKKIKKEHFTQIQFGLMVTGRKSLDYVLFNPNFPKSLIIQNIERDEEYIENIKKELVRAEEEVQQIIKQYAKLAEVKND